MIYLSAGHHPRAPGAAWKGFVEHNEAVLWVNEIQRYLNAGIIVPPDELSRKIRWVNERAARDDVLVEIHFNAATPTAEGCETLYAPGSVRSQKVAHDLLEAMEPYFKSRGVKPGWYQQDPKKGPLALLTKTRCAAVIIEPEFIYHSARIREHRPLCCAALANVVKRYL
jgi:N-acetylmuramoyl-L-alanine amidase